MEGPLAAVIVAGLVTSVGGGMTVGHFLGLAYAFLFQFEDRALATDAGRTLVGAVGFAAWAGWAIAETILWLQQ